MIRPIESSPSPCTLSIHRRAASAAWRRQRVPVAARWAAAGILVWAAAACQAAVRLPALFTDHMVLQRDRPVPVWGWADEGEVVTVEFRGERATATARGGKWSVRLRAQQAGGPFTLTVTGKNRIQINDVLVGEVWVCSGQSNMQWAMSQSHEPAQAINASANPRIRLFYVPRVKAKVPADDVAAKWETCQPESVRGFSAVAYYFGRDLEAALGVPVGLIHTSWGGSPAEVWMSREVLAANPDYQRQILDQAEESWKRYQDALSKFQQEQEELKRQGKASTARAPAMPWQATELYNAMIAPLIPYAIRGAIWYQGESNAGRAHQYRSLFPDMIRNWRRDWGQGDFPFLAVQLAPWDRNKRRSIEEITATPVESDWAELREAQWLATRLLPEVGMAVITDYGDKDDIHPAKKEPVGARLALAARGIAYGEKIAYSGPIYRSKSIRGNKVVLRFDHVHGGLEARGGALQGFAICGPDRQFVWAQAEIQGNRIAVSSPKVPKPVAVRFGWSDFPVVNLFNKAGLPASPFRTDDFPLTTAPKKPAN